MKQWRLTASTNGVNIDFETIITAESEPGFWDCYELAGAHGCPFFDLSELTE